MNDISADGPCLDEGSSCGSSDVDEDDVISMTHTSTDSSGEDSTESSKETIDNDSARDSAGKYDSSLTSNDLSEISL